MTDNDIIEALECCAVLNSCDKCPWCSLDVADCTTLLAQGCLDLINRQKAEIEKLKADVKYLTSENENLTTARAEAIKEFAERLTERIFNRSLVEVYEHIDNLVEEMTGGISDE